MFDKVEYLTTLLPHDDSDSVHADVREAYAATIKAILNARANEGWRLKDRIGRLAIFEQAVKPRDRGRLGNV